MASADAYGLAWPSLLLFLVIALVSYRCIRAVIDYRRLRQFKGPPLAAVSELWLFRQSLKQQVAESVAEAIERYGSPARIGPNMLVTDDPALLRHMSAPRSNFTRGEWYKAMKLDTRQDDNVFSTQSEKRHTELRAKLIGGYSGRDLTSLEANVDEQVLQLTWLIRRSYTVQPLDFARLAGWFTLDVLSKVAFGDAFGFLPANTDLFDYNKLTSAFLPFMEIICNHPTIRAIIHSPPMQAMGAPKPTDKVGMGVVIGKAHEVVTARYGPNAKQTDDMLGSFIRHSLTLQEAEAESMLQILAGSDSTSSAVRMTFLYILSNPLVYSKLRAEIDAAVARGAVSHPVITNAEALGLPYLQACIWESLRMWPPLVGLQSKKTPPGGESVNGTFLPGGTEIAISPIACTRSKAVFGDDAAIYRPERWLEASAATTERYHRQVDVIFGTGRFVCLGRNIAMMELNKVFVELIRGFDWAVADPMRAGTVVSHGMHLYSDMYLVARERER